MKTARPPPLGNAGNSRLKKPRDDFGCGIAKNCRYCNESLWKNRGCSGCKDASDKSRYNLCKECYKIPERHHGRCTFYRALRFKFDEPVQVKDSNSDWQDGIVKYLDGGGIIVETRSLGGATKQTRWDHIKKYGGDCVLR